MTYMIFLIIVFGEGRGERRKSPGTKVGIYQTLVSLLQ
jgi:hypothetical protein